MSPTLRKSVLAAVSGGAFVIASALITGPTGNDGLEGVRYDPYQDVVGVWTVCYGHTGKDIMLGKTYTEAECRALLNKDLNTVARQINPYIKNRSQKQCVGLCTHSPITSVPGTSRPPHCFAKSTRVTLKERAINCAAGPMPKVSSGKDLLPEGKLSVKCVYGS